MKHFKVLEVIDVSEWASQHGPMVSNKLAVEEVETGKREQVDLNSKPGNLYKVGDDFWATSTGKEYGGFAKYKRAKAPDVSPPTMPKRFEPLGDLQLGPGQVIKVSTPPMPYETACKLFASMTERFNEPSMWNGIGTQILMAVVLGKIESPLKPLSVVRFMGNDLETAGVQQEAWEEMMKLCDQLERAKDKIAVRALLIATTQTQTRKDLTAEKADLFIAALRANLAAIGRQREAEDGYNDPPF